jgi:hypothetical protein
MGGPTDDGVVRVAFGGIPSEAKAASSEKPR